MAAKLGQEALGAYVISMASSPSDVLAVKLLQVGFVCDYPCRLRVIIVLVSFRPVPGAYTASALRQRTGI